MFRSAYVKLTAFYVATIFFISFIFSLWVYHEATRELETGLTTRDRFGVRRQILPVSENFLHDKLEEGKARVIINLVYFNLVLLGVGGVLSYWLARRTMFPIETAMDTQNRFTADASHELRTPLAAMKMELEVALRDKKRTRKETEALLTSNLEEVNRLVDLSEALLSLARDNEAPLYNEIVLSELFEKLEKRFMPLARKKHIMIDNKVQTKKMITTDQTSLEQILAILIDNALKYSPENTTVTFSVYKKKKMLHLIITDQGYGIPLKDRQHIFKRFYRADISRSGQHIKGNGLGLAIAHKRAKSLKAQLKVRPNIGGGSIFTIVLPS